MYGFRNGRNVAFIVTRYLWYALRVYVGDVDDPGNFSLLSRTGHNTMDDVQVISLF